MNHDSLSHITQWGGTIKPRTSEKQPSGYPISFSFVGFDCVM